MDLKPPSIFIISVLALVVGCEGREFEPTPWSWELPFGFPPVSVPDDNPMTVEKVELGRHLFYDTRLSLDGTFSCASCHGQELAFTDGKGRGVGVTGDVHPRGAMSLANVAYASTLNWANPLEKTLEHQALTPMFGEDPIELGLAGREHLLIASFEEDHDAFVRFERAFPDEARSVSIRTITQGLASFQRTMISGNSPYDRYLRGDRTALSESARRGSDLFFSEELECFHCHGGFNFSASIAHEGLVFSENAFHSNGLYNIAGAGDYPESNQGLFAFTNRPEDRGRFKAPTLRNIAVTAPYMHDGSLETLDAVIDHYAAGGRLIEDGPYAGDGRLHPNKSAFINGFELNAQERVDLKSFLESLTDEQFLRDPKFSEPD